MTIARLAQKGGVGVETVRYYQRRGLMLLPDRAKRYGLGRGVRHYDVADIRRLKFIRSAQSAGFTLEEIGELLALDATDDRTKAMEMARARVAALDAKISELRAARRALSKLADECRAGASGPCPILAAFDRA